MVFTAGVPVGVSGTTNFLRVHTVGEIIIKGTGIGRKPAAGRAKIARSAAEAADIKEDEILVAYATDKDYLPAMQRAAGLVVEEGGLTSHAAVVALNLGLPVIIGAEDAVKVLKEGELITLDTVRGVIYRGRVKIF